VWSVQAVVYTPYKVNLSAVSVWVVCCECLGYCANFFCGYRVSLLGLWQQVSRTCTTITTLTVRLAWHGLGGRQGTHTVDVMSSSLGGIRFLGQDRAGTMPGSTRNEPANCGQQWAFFVGYSNCACQRLCQRCNPCSILGCVALRFNMYKKDPLPTIQLDLDCDDARACWTGWHPLQAVQAVNQGRWQHPRVW
jgi:hypothetical protein